MSIQVAESDSQILECFSVLSQLRPHIKQESFLEQVRRQQQNGHRMIYLEENHQAKAVAIFCISENFACGLFLHVYDLVVDATVRSQGYGHHIFEWLVNYAKLHGCKELSLDSGVQRFDAHRFYIRHQMNISGHHFSLPL
ncbi:GNAT family N-acetyltransferase [Oscillatoria sp. FACHB-1407]|uniref:GNAT family N-acetyltransferase n=1 Tax=Oscillatoria sp. FACHB-1407 TaxID=2692847 RepID=UPI00168261BE|nr:GNAT family N-acetyltransferase [Oscillatoria sp. FACHB-1407]MBD2465842.1 GNAT family N-acetyltransferase [Oscillatoria sp. FACHB-1407]